jgi:tRNA threonylcarbamoyladenosine biosynthesis protein TsaB
MKIFPGLSKLINMTEDKPILAIETSESLCSTAVYFSDEKYFQSVLRDRHSHAEKLMASIEHSLNSAGISVKDIGSIAVSSGPGSFTGLRIGMSAAKGLALGADLAIIPVPTFEAMAMQISEYLNLDSEFIIANKVNSEEIYYARFQVIANKTIFVDNLQVIKKTDFKGKTNTLQFGNVSLNENRENRIMRNIISPDAVHIARWANTYGKNLATYDYDYLEPDYHKNFIIKAKKHA